MAPLGMTMIMVDKNTLKMLNEAIEHVDEAISYGAIAEDEGGVTKMGLTNLRDRIRTALG